ncbi:MAG: ABC transporter substrate-binding protein [Candidatus Ozemobacteraceae bacterium]
MLRILKKSFLGLVFIALAALLLLLSDLGNRREKPKNEIPKVAIIQIVSRPTLDDSAKGVVAALEEKGFIDGKTISIKKFNPENDVPTANTIAKAVLDGGFKLVITLSTPALQIMANANKNTKMPHVFGVVTDPFAAGVGVEKGPPSRHPPYMAGMGTFQPVKEVFRIAKKIFPDLKTVGVTWNPAESCSESCLELAREVCLELKITLIENHSSSAEDALESARALVAQGVQALWIGGDNTVETAISSLVKAGDEGRIPVFTNNPPLINQGAFFGLGADYFQVGKEVGNMSSEILSGKNPYAFEVKNFVPPQFSLNLKKQAELREKWIFPREILESAAFFIDREGRLSREKKQEATATPTIVAIATATTIVSTGKKKVVFLYFVENDFTEDTMRGAWKGFQSRGWEKDVDFSSTVYSAQGDISTLMSLLDNIITDKPDLLFVIATPALQATIKKNPPFPVVFTTVADGILAGAGKTASDHIPNITGISTLLDAKGMVELIQKAFPNAKKIGWLYNPGEVNAVKSSQVFSKTLTDAGMEILKLPVSSSAEVYDAAAALCAQNIDVFCQIPDNICSTAFAPICKAAMKTKKPLLSFLTGHVKNSGAIMAVGRDYEQAGIAAASLSVDILLGADPAKIPLSTLEKSIRIINIQNADNFGLKFPDSILKEMDSVITASATQK